jgi:hypothetical protein
MVIRYPWGDDLVHVRSSIVLGIICFVGAGRMSQRRWMRFPSDVSTVPVIAHGCSLGQAAVVDESFAGIAIDLDDLRGLNLHEQVEIRFRGQQRPCIVRYIVPMASGRYRVGLEWVNSTEPALLLHA